MVYIRFHPNFTTNFKEHLGGFIYDKTRAKYISREISWFRQRLASYYHSENLPITVKTGSSLSKKVGWKPALLLQTKTLNVLILYPLKKDQKWATYFSLTYNTKATFEKHSKKQKKSRKHRFWIPLSVKLKSTVLVKNGFLYEDFLGDSLKSNRLIMLNILEQFHPWIPDISWWKLQVSELASISSLITRF